MEIDLVSLVKVPSPLRIVAEWIAEWLHKSKSIVLCELESFWSDTRVQGNCLIMVIEMYTDGFDGILTDNERYLR